MPNTTGSDVVPANATTGLVAGTVLVQRSRLAGFEAPSALLPCREARARPPRHLLLGVSRRGSYLPANMVRLRTQLAGPSPRMGYDKLFRDGVGPQKKGKPMPLQGLLTSVSRPILICWR